MQAENNENEKSKASGHEMKSQSPSCSFVLVRVFGLELLLEACSGSIK